MRWPFRRRRLSRRRPPDEAGATLVLVAFMLVFMLGIAAIVIDGGQAYTDRRRMQNAADAAALAGARTLGQIRLAGATVDLQAAVRSVATVNKATAADAFACDVVDRAGAVVAPCAPSTGWSSRADAAGVRVGAGIRRTPVFGAVAGGRELLVRASATASLQPLLSARSPWMICGSAALAGGYDLIDPGTRTLRPDTALRARYGEGGSALVDVRGIPIQGALPGTCGLSGGWAGAVSPSAQPVRLGAFVTPLIGAPAGSYAHDDILSTGGCPTNFRAGDVQTCSAVVPVFDETDPVLGSVRVVAWSIWTMTYSSAGPVTWWGTFVGAGVASGGVASDGPVTGRSTYVVRVAR